MTPSPNCAVPESPDTLDPVLAGAVDVARAAAAEEAGVEPVGQHVGVEVEPGGAATHLFTAELPGYRGWRWAVTVATAGPDTPVTVSEVVLLPGPDALVAPEWVPWQQRIQAGDLGVGDLMPTESDDPRLVPGYVESDDPAVEDVQRELGLGRVRVMSRFGRLDSADRWQSGDFGPRSEMARSAPDHCGRCGFYLPLDGSLRAAFGVCGNEMAPADGRVVHVEYGCGAHSEVELDVSSPVPVADLVYDDTTMDVEPPLSAHPGDPEAAPQPEPVEATTTETPTDTVTGTIEAPADAPTDAVIETPTEDAPVESITETPAEIETAVETPADTVIETVEAPADAPADAVIEAPADAVIETPADAVIETPEDALVEPAAEAPVEIETAVETPADDTATE